MKLCEIWTDRQQRVRDWLDGLGDPLRLYREIVLPQDGRISLDPVGRHWTPERDKAVAPFGRSDHSTGERIILSALVSRSAVDETQTISNMLRYGEYEITLRPGVRIEIDGHGAATV